MLEGKVTLRDLTHGSRSLTSIILPFIDIQPFHPSRGSPLRECVIIYVLHPGVVGYFHDPSQQSQALYESDPLTHIHTVIIIFYLAPSPLSIYPVSNLMRDNLDGFLKSHATKVVHSVVDGLGSATISGDFI